MSDTDIHASSSDFFHVQRMPLGIDKMAAVEISLRHVFLTEDAESSVSWAHRCLTQSMRATSKLCDATQKAHGTSCCIDHHEDSFPSRTVRKETLGKLGDLEISLTL